MLDGLKVGLLFPINTGKAPGLEAMLELLEGEPLATPTHANYDSQKRAPYDRTSVLQQRASFRISGFSLWRTKAPKYPDAYLGARDNAYNHIVLKYAGGLPDAKVESLFATWTRLAEATKTEFGFLHCLIKNGRSEAYNYGAGVNLKHLSRCGLESLYARTWLGPELTEVIGQKRLLGLPNSRSTSWGGVELDLTPEPWKADFDTLFTRQKALVKTFSSWGVIGDYSDFSEPLPGPSWTPRSWGL